MMYKMVPGSPPLGSHEYPTLDAAKEAAERFVSFPSEESTALRDRLKSLLASDPERAADARSIDLVDGIGKFAYQETRDLGHGDEAHTCLTCERQLTGRSTSARLHSRSQIAKGPFWRW